MGDRFFEFLNLDGEHMSKGRRKSELDLIQELISKIKGLHDLVDEVSHPSISEGSRKFKIQLIAVVLRDLLIDTANQESLFRLLDIKERMFFDVKFTPLSGPYNLVTESKLTKFLLVNGKLYFEPNDFDGQHYYIGFKEWMNEIVIDTKNQENSLVTRREIIMAVADTMGAHTDPHYEKKYDEICNFNGLKCYVEIDGEKYNPENNPYYEILISISKEVLNSYDSYRKYRNDAIRYNDSSLSVYCMFANYQDSSNPSLFRFFVWLKGSNPGAVMNRVHFDLKSSNLKKHCLGQVRTLSFVDARNRLKHSIPYFDFSNPLQLIPVVSEDKSVYTVISMNDHKFSLLSGSCIRRNGKIDSSKLLDGENNFLLIEDLPFKSINEIYDLLDIAQPQ